ncbi:MAG: diguanylate cyclase [Rhodocyclaceae bacterium]|nr:MAG: diguanylate cyclase [Rhodocyclaceae bacterium]
MGRLGHWGSPLRSLRTRIAAGVLLGLLLALWGATLLVGYVLRQEMQATLAAQQFSVVTLLADEIDRSVSERMRALQAVADDFDAAKLASPAALERELRDQHVLLTLFNWGVLVTDRQGTTLVSLPDELGRGGVNYMDVPAVRRTLESGEAQIGPALIGKTTLQPVVPMIVPIRDPGGAVLGAVIGLINLANANFLDEISANRFGRHGGYLITDPVQRLFIAATDKSRVMTPGPPPGVNPVYDHYLAGNDGSGLARSSRGVVELSSSRRVKSTGWLMQSVLPGEEAFAPLYAMQWRLLGLAAALTVLASVLVWWWLRRQLRPLGEAAEQLGRMRDGLIPRQALPVRRDDEIGALTGAFNGLLTTILEGEARAAEHALNQRLRSIVSQIPGLVFQYRLDGDGHHSVPFASDALRELFGLEPDCLLASADALHARVLPEDLPALLAAVSESARELSRLHREFRIAHPARGVRWMRFDALPEAADSGGVTWQGFATDITEAKETELKLRIAAATFEGQEGIFITDAEGRIVQVNQAFTAMTGYSAREAIGQTPAMLRSGRHGQEFYRRLYAGLERDGFWQGEIWNRRKNGEVFVEWVTISAVRDDAGQVTHYVAAFSDITEHKKAEEQVHQLAFYDPLTQLPNRRLFHDRLEQALVASARSRHGGALLFLDLDGFKGLNDTHGHVMGDALLVEVAHRLVDSLRESDTVARLGGDEFVVILENLDEEERDAESHAGRVAEKLREELARPYHLSVPGGSDSVIHQCTASVGVCMFLGHEESRDELIKRADIAMYRAKDAGRNAVRFFDPRRLPVPLKLGC